MRHRARVKCKHIWKAFVKRQQIWTTKSWNSLTAICFLPLFSVILFGNIYAVFGFYSYHHYYDKNFCYRIYLRLWKFLPLKRFNPPLFISTVKNSIHLVYSSGFKYNRGSFFSQVRIFSAINITIIRQVFVIVCYRLAPLLFIPVFISLHGYYTANNKATIERKCV